MEYLMFLRFIHIVCAVFWGGAIMYQAWFIIPTVKVLGPDGGKFMQQLAKTNKFPVMMMIAGGLTVLGGLLLIERLSGGFKAFWFGTPHGIVISTGATFAIVAYAIGIVVNLPAIKRMTALGAAVARSGEPPSAEQAAELNKLRNRVFKMTNIMAGLVFLAAAAMSLARYIN